MPTAPHPSPYAHRVAALVEQIRAAFFSEMALSGQAFPESMLPGERFGQIKFNTFGEDTTRPTISSNRGGFEARVYGFTAVLQFAFEMGDLSEDEVYRTSDSLFLEESLNLDNAFAYMKAGIDSQEMAWDIYLDASQDSATSQMVSDDRMGVCNLTAEGALQVMIYKDSAGRHQAPETLHEVANAG